MNERWDAALLVEQESVAAFLAFASNTEYLAGMGTLDGEHTRQITLIQ